MKLFQYWDNAHPPAEVAEWIDGFRAGNSDFDHELYNQDTAAAFIGKHYGSREVAAFGALRVPAMQADYVRLCLIDTFGGLYCDADHQFKEPLSGFVAENSGPVMVRWYNVLNTAFLLFPTPGNPFIRACLDLCTENVENRRFTSVFTATGPGIQNAIAGVLDPAHLERVWPSFSNMLTIGWGFDELLDITRAFLASPSADLHAAFRDIQIHDTLSLTRWIGSDAPSYKETDKHWVNWKGPIYK